MEERTRLRCVAIAATVVTFAGGLAAPMTPASAATPTAPGSFRSVGPARLLDTGTGVGAAKAPVAANATVVLQVTGRGGVPSTGVGSVVLNVTTASATANGSVTVYSYGHSRPGTPNLPYGKGVTGSNLVTVPVGTGGKVSLFNGSTGKVRLIADVQGYTLNPPAPAITTLSPTSGSTAGGTSVTITGTNLGSATGVSFGGTAGTGLTSNTATALTVTTPAHAAGAVTVTVTTAGGTSIGLTYTYNVPPAVPAITAVSPSFGPTAGGTSVTITGTNLADATEVFFGGYVGSDISANTATSLTVTTPSHDTGTVDVIVTTSAGSSPTGPGDEFHYIGPVSDTGAAGFTTTSTTLTWTNPSDNAFTGVQIRRTDGTTPPAAPTDGTAVTTTSGNVDLYTDTGLTAGHTYSYALFADHGTFGLASPDTTTVTIPTRASITGTVSDTAATGIANVTVRAYEVDGTGAGTTVTAADGSYSIAGLDAGDYTVCFNAAGSGSGTYGYLPQCWKNITGTDVPHTVSVPSRGAPVTGIDATLATGGSISGVVTDTAHSPIQHVIASVYNSTGEPVAVPVTAADGTWNATGLAAGTYTVCFDPTHVQSSTAYAPQCWNNITPTPTAITVSAGAAATGINAALSPVAPTAARPSRAASTSPSSTRAATAGGTTYPSTNLQNLPCYDVLFLAARGSGNPGPGGKNQVPNDPNDGVGGPVFSAYQEFANDFTDGQKVSPPISVSYPADNVYTPVILDGAYIDDLWKGVAETRRALTARATQCPNERIVLAGYSQGAMVMHRVLTNAPTSTSTGLASAVLNRIDAAILIADGDRVDSDTTQDYGTAKTYAQGVGTQLDATITPSKLPYNLGNKAFSICDYGDAVCDFRVPYLCPICAVWHDSDGIFVHMHYAGKSEVLDAARAASLLEQTGHAPPQPPVITTRTLPAGFTNRYYGTELTTADHRSGTWSITNGTLPAGLILSGYSITGTPTSVGTSIFVLTFADTNGFVVHASASIGIQDGAAQTLTWTPALLADPGSGPTQSVSCADATLCIASDQAGFLQTFDGTSWSRAEAIKPLSTDFSGPSLTYVSCAPRTNPASAGFCMAEGGNQWATYDGTSWSAVNTIVPNGPANSGPLSCTSSSFCMLTFGVNAYVYDGAVWSQISDVAATYPAPTTLSCASAVFCMASTDQAADDWLYNGAVWAAVTGPSEAQLTCPAANRCFGINSSAGTVDTWTGSDWHTSLTGAETALSCGTPQFCIAVDTYGNGMHFNGTSWVNDSWAGPWFVVWARTGHVLSCAQDQSCYLLDATGGGYQYKQGGWTGHTWVGPYVGGADSLSCVQTHCTAADRFGNSWTTDDAILSSPPRVADLYAQGSLWGQTSVSCASSFCAMTDMLGGAAVYNGSYWYTSQGDSGDNRTDGPVISCVSSTFCAGVDDSGNAFFYRGYSWSAPQKIATQPGSSLDAISCASTTFCVATSGYPTAYIWNGSTWTATSAPPAGIDSISCPEVNFCVAVGYQSAMYFDGTNWSAAATIASGQAVVSVSCVSALSCVALARPSYNDTGTGGSVLTFNGATWSAPTVIATVGDPVSISCGTPSFCAVIDYEGREYFGASP